MTRYLALLALLVAVAARARGEEQNLTPRGAIATAASGS